MGPTLELSGGKRVRVCRHFDPVSLCPHCLGAKQASCQRRATARCSGKAATLEP